MSNGLIFASRNNNLAPGLGSGRLKGKSMDRVQIGKVIRARREELGLSVTKLARELSFKTGKAVTTKKISGVENNEVGYTVDSLLDLLDLLGLEIEIKVK